MKAWFKTSMVALTLLTSSSIFAGGPEEVPVPIFIPNNFNGFFIGANGSFRLSTFNINTNGNLVTTTTDPETSSTFTNLTGGDSGVDGYFGIQGGVGKVFDHLFYVGIEGFTDLGSAPGNSSSSTAAPFVGDTPNQAASLSNTVEISDDYGVVIKPGLLLSDKTMAYAKFGAAWVQLQINSKLSVFDATTGTTINATTSNDDTQVSFIWGVGIEHYIYDHVTVNLEYNYVDINGISAPNSAPSAIPVVLIGAPDAVSVNSSVSAKYSSLMGGLNFYFGGDWI